MLETKITEIAIGQIRGLVKPSEQERAAAFELFVEFGSRTTTAPLTLETGTIRGASCSSRPASPPCPRSPSPRRSRRGS